MIDPDSLGAAPAPGATRTFDSWAAGWRGLLLRGYAEPLAVDDYDTSLTRDQKIVLVTKGACRIERRKDGPSRGAWHGAAYRPGRIGFVAPGEAARLRWSGVQRHHTLQVHLPGALIAEVARGLGCGRAALDGLSLIDPVIATTMLALERAARAGAPDLHAETAAYFLASHLLLGQGRLDSGPEAAPDAGALCRVEDHMRASLSRPLTLGALAGTAGMSRFRFLRAAKAAWGETPMRRLTRLRMECAQRLLLSGHLTVIEVALECGYGSPAHFATAFRRFSGLSPSAYGRMARN